MNVTVYSKPNCPQCEATKRHMSRLSVDFSVIDITQDAHALQQLKAADFRQAPVVKVSDGEERYWSGYRPDLIEELPVNQPSVFEDVFSDSAFM